MAAPETKLISIIAAALLSGVTLSTFYLLRNYGPESAIQRFHAAALAGDQTEISKLTLRPDSPNVVELVAEVRKMARLGARPEVENAPRGPREVIVQIVYRSAYAEETIFWDVAETKASRWLIDADRCTIRRPW